MDYHDQPHLSETFKYFAPNSSILRHRYRKIDRYQRYYSSNSEDTLSPIDLSFTANSQMGLSNQSWLFQWTSIYGLLHLCWCFAVGPFSTWLISSSEENKCCYKLSNWQNENYFHSKWQLRTFWEWNRCHFVHLFSSQLEISDVLNGTTP